VLPTTAGTAPVTTNPEEASMHCPFCRHADSRVVDSRTSDDGLSIRRRRQCPQCNRRFTTIETASLSVVKRSGATEPFSRDKIVSGVRKACQGRPVSEDDLAILAQRVEETLRASGSAELDAYEIGLAILGPLRDLDEVAYLRFASVYRVLYFLPYVAMPTAVAMVWRIIYNGDFGILNWVLALVGIDGPYWISTPGAAIVAVALVGLWSSLGFALIVLAAGLKNIPPELYEASELDGATPSRQFRAITVPLLSPSIFFVLIVTVIASFQLFDLLYAILGSTNPVLPKSMSLVYLFYSEGFVKNDKGYAAAVAMVIFLIIGLATLVQFRLQRKWVHSD